MDSELAGRLARKFEWIGSLLLLWPPAGQSSFREMVENAPADFMLRNRIDSSDGRYHRPIRAGSRAFV